MSEQLSETQPVVWEASDDPELRRRAFRIETLRRGGQTLNLLSLEADFIDDERITPPDWEERVACAIDEADVTVVEYFTPELEENMPYLHQLGSYSAQRMATYGKIAEMAHNKGVEVAVADIANKPLYQAYNMGVLPAIGAAAIGSQRRGGFFGTFGFTMGEAYIASMTYQAAYKKGTFDVEPSRMERFMPSANDARRALTARGIDQLANELSKDATVLYIAAPAHTSRVKMMLEQPRTAVDSAKAALYKNMAGLDRSLRVYSPAEEGWVLRSATPIR